MAMATSVDRESNSDESQSVESTRSRLSSDAIEKAVEAAMEKSMGIAIEAVKENTIEPTIEAVMEMAIETAKEMAMEILTAENAATIASITAQHQKDCPSEEIDAVAPTPDPNAFISDTTSPTSDETFVASASPTETKAPAITSTTTNTVLSI